MRETTSGARGGSNTTVNTSMCPLSQALLTATALHHNLVASPYGCGASASASVGTSSKAMPASTTGGLNVIIKPLSLMAPRSSTVAPQLEALVSISDLAGTHLSAAQLDELMGSKEVQKNTSDAIKKLKMANPLGLVNENKSWRRRRGNKNVNTLCGQPIWDQSQANANRPTRIRESKSLLETSTAAQDKMPLEDWDNDHIQEAVQSMYAATALAHTLNALRQDIPYTPFGTSLKYEDLPEQQRVILAQIESVEPNMFGHLVGQMIAKPFMCQICHRSRGCLTQSINS